MASTRDLRRVAANILRHGAPYRASSSDEWECIGGLPPPEDSRPSSHGHPPLFTDAQLDSALDLMQTNALDALQRADFEAFGRRLSWVKLADGCVHRLSSDLLQLQHVRDVRERADLLRRRLETRKAAGQRRTPTKTQTAINDLYAASVAVNDLQTLSGGSLVRDVDGALGRLTVMMRRWRAVEALAPHVRARTDDLVRMIRSAIETVIGSNVSDGTKAYAKRVWGQWCPASRSAQGTSVNFDSD